MKRLLLILLLFLSAITLSADPVDQHTARQAAANFALANNFPSDEPSLVTTPFSHLYLFTFPGDNGFILLSADDRVTPILGYSLTNPFILDNMPDHVKDWLQDYEDQIDYAISQDIAPTSLTTKQWTNLLDGDDVPTVTPLDTPLIKTKWAQGTYYNNLCPTLSSGKRTVTGCVATATAQIMKYHNHPQSGVGSHSYEWNNTTLTADFKHTTYDWANMPNVLSNTSTSTEINAVATLMYHIGVAVEMNYASVSTSYTYYQYGNPPSAESALQVFFKYSNEIHNVYYSQVGDAKFKQLLKNEIDSARPVLYSGRTTNSGHAFICDGYDSIGLFHFNYGWGGGSDGYYRIGSLVYGYDYRNVAVINIKPLSETLPAQTVVTASVDDPSHGTVAGTGIYNPVDTIELVAWANDGYLFDHWDDGNRYDPIYTYANTPTYNRTAYFRPLPTETLSYCEDDWWTSFGDTASYTWNWGIRYPANTIPANRQLDTVKFYSYERGTFIAKIYQGDTTNMTLMCTASLTTTNRLTWFGIPLTTPYPIDTTKSLWITLERTGTGYPMTVSGNFYGTSDCMCMYDSTSGWIPYPEYGIYYSFMIKGVTSQASQPTTLQYNNTVSQDWSNPASWSPNIVPNSVTDVTINATCTIPDNYTAYARTLTLTSNSTLVIMPSGALSVETLTNTTASNLLLKADTTHQATVLFNSGTPQANVENCFRGTTHQTTTSEGTKYNPDWQYRGFIGNSPTFTNWNAVIFRWDETNNPSNCWTLEYEKSGTFNPSPWLGYSIANYGSANAINNYTSQLIPTSQPHTYPLTRTGTTVVPNLGVNLITNSYSAPIDMRSSDITFGENVEQTFYFFNTLTHDEYLQDTAAAIVEYPVATGYLLGISQYIPAGQSFAVITNANDDSLKIGTNALRPISNGKMYAPANPDDINILEITISNANSLDRLTLIEHPSCTSDFDNGYDGTKLLRSSSPQIYAVNSFGNTAVNSDRTLLGQKIGCTPTTDNEQCTLTFNTDRLKDYTELYLYDRLTHTYTDILTTQTYTFTATTTTTPRFELVGQRTASENFVTSSDPMLEIISNRALASGFSDPDLTIYLSDLKGTTLWSDRISNGPWFTLPTNLPPGIYILHCANISTKYLPR